MKSKILFVFTFCLLGSTIVSCIYGTCDPVPPYFEIKGIQSNNMRFTYTGTIPWEVLDENESINWTNFFTRFRFEVNYIAVLQHFGGTLFAESCDEPGGAGSKIGVDMVIVRTVNDYNENYSAGSVINDIILTNQWTLRSDDFDDFLPITNYLTENAKGVRSEIFELKLTEAPTTSGSFAFNVTYKLNNGEEFQHQTATVNLIK